MCGCLLCSPTGDLTWPTTQACALTGNQTGNPLVRRPVLNPLSHTSQGPKLFISKHFGCLGFLVRDYELVIVRNLRTCGPIGKQEVQGQIK